MNSYTWKSTIEHESFNFYKSQSRCFLLLYVVARAFQTLVNAECWSPSQREEGSESMGVLGVKEFRL
jgi:hypothetical protein